MEKLERDEPLGDQATIAMILYANQNHPGLKAQYPDWKDRFKQINKIWKQLANDKRQPYVQQARENRTASRMNKQVCIGILLLLIWVIDHFSIIFTNDLFSSVACFEHFIHWNLFLKLWC